MNRNAVRLGNTDPALIKFFLKFLTEIYQIDTQRLRFGLQVFNDSDPVKAKKFWQEKLQIEENQFQKVVITPARAQGTYRRKNHHGVLTVYFSNTKLRDMIVGAMTELQEEKMPS